MIKNSDLNCEMNTGCINRLNHVPKSCNLAPSNAPKNTKKKWFSISLEIKLVVLLGEPENG